MPRKRSAAPSVAELEAKLAEAKAREAKASSTKSRSYSFTKLTRKDGDVLAFVEGRADAYTLSPFAAALAEAMSKGLKIS